MVMDCMQQQYKGACVWPVDIGVYLCPSSEPTCQNALGLWSTTGDVRQGDLEELPAV